MFQLRSTPLGCKISARISPGAAPAAVPLGAGAAAPQLVAAFVSSTPTRPFDVPRLLSSPPESSCGFPSPPHAALGRPGGGALPRGHPGGAGEGLPAVAPPLAAVASAGAMAHSPKSHRWTSSRAAGASTSPRTRMFSGLMSRWTTPCSRQWSSARSMLRETACASGASSTARWSINSYRSVPPFSITRCTYSGEWNTSMSRHILLRGGGEARAMRPETDVARRERERAREAGAGGRDRPVVQRAHHRDLGAEPSYPSERPRGAAPADEFALRDVLDRVLGARGAHAPLHDRKLAAAELLGQPVRPDLGERGDAVLDLRQALDPRPGRLEELHSLEPQHS